MLEVPYAHMVELSVMLLQGLQASLVQAVGSPGNRICSKECRKQGEFLNVNHHALHIGQLWLVHPYRSYKCAKLV